MSFLITLPFLLQAIVIGVDEYVFHLKRGLPKWERIGHPVDTFSVLLCLGCVLFFPYSDFLLKVYIGLVLFSCLLVTKDEFVHKECCPASEQWLHALLFINHPIMLAAAGLIWPVIGSDNPPLWLSGLKHPIFLRAFLIGQFIFIALFFLYQVIYWNFIWKPKSTTLSTKI